MCIEKHEISKLYNILMLLYSMLMLWEQVAGLNRVVGQAFLRKQEQRFERRKWSEPGR